MTLSLLNCLLVSLLAGALASPQQTPAETPAERDCRLKGVCERNGVKCLKMERFNMCKAFTDAFMPMDITDFLNTKLPGVDWGKSPPRPFVDTDDINGWFGNLTSKAGIYNKREAGCEAPSQRWWNTWVCTSIGQYYFEKGNPCGFTKRVCKSTIDERAQLFKEDFENPKICGQISPENRRAAENYLKLISNLPYASTEAACVQGDTNEEFSPQCGWLVEAQACRKNCNKLLPDVAKDCPRIIADADKAINQGVNPVETQKATKDAPVTAIVGGVIGGVALVGVLVLARSMKKSAPSVEESHDAPKPQKPAQELNNVAVPMAAMQANTVDPRQSQAYNQAPPSPYAQPPVQQSYNQSPVQSSYNSSVQQSFVQQPVQQPFGQPPVQQSFMDNRQSVMSNQYPGSPDIAAIQSPVTYAATSSPSPVVAPAAPQAQYRVTIEFTPTQDDEVSMTLGDVVVVNEQFEDGWAYGRNLSNGREGFFPMSCFQLQQQPQGGWAERTLSLNRRQ